MISAAAASCRNVPNGTPQRRRHPRTRRTTEAKEILHHRLRGIGAHHHPGRRRVGKDHAGPKDMPPIVQSRLAAAGDDTLQHVVTKSPTVDHVVGITKLAPAHDDGEPLPPRRRQVEKKIPPTRYLGGQELGRIGPVYFVHLITSSIHL